MHPPCTDGLLHSVRRWQVSQRSWSDGAFSKNVHEDKFTGGDNFLIVRVRHRHRRHKKIFFLRSPPASNPGSLSGYSAPTSTWRTLLSAPPAPAPLFQRLSSLALFLIRMASHSGTGHPGSSGRRGQARECTPTMPISWAQRGQPWNGQDQLSYSIRNIFFLEKKPHLSRGVLLAGEEVAEDELHLLAGVVVAGTAIAHKRH